jgi:hypothetical protein
MVFWPLDYSCNLSSVKYKTGTPHFFLQHATDGAAWTQVASSALSKPNFCLWHELSMRMAATNTPRPHTRCGKLMPANGMACGRLSRHVLPEQRREDLSRGIRCHVGASVSPDGVAQVGQVNMWQVHERRNNPRGFHRRRTRQLAVQPSQCLNAWISNM